MSNAKQILKESWKEKVLNDIAELKVDKNKVLDYTLTSTAACQFLICSLIKNNIPFKTSSYGSGVKNFTTDTTTCPCCKRKL